VLNLANERRFMRDVGIWSAERLYGPGATVTKDGCAWTAQVETKGVKPGTSSDWRLLQKSVDVELRKEIRNLVRDELRRAKP
jgi:chitodextrinase